MCSIVGIFEIQQSIDTLRPQALKMSKRLRHRGPDWSGIYCGEKAILAHERLAIVDPQSGRQPLYSPDGKVILAVNGEIYNHQEIRDRQAGTYEFKTKSDCEVILSLYKEKGVNFLEDLNGIFAFALYDEEKDAYLIARDHIGIIPLYMGWDKDGAFYVASELKALEGYCEKIESFPPGHYLYSVHGEKGCTVHGNEQPELVRWYKRDWMDYENVKDNPSVDDTENRAPDTVHRAPIASLREALEAAVKRQLMTDVPYGVLLSGGLDSSIVSAVAKKYASRRIEGDGTEKAWWPRLHSFAVGLEGSPDLAAARKVADHIGTVHHEVHFTIQEGLDAIRDVIYHIETYDVTTIRASTPMYLLARVIRSMGIKMVLSGEGADEIFGGYLYFHKAPDAKALHEETVRKLDKLHLYDCLRANKSLAAWGVEGRVPFLDKEFMDVAMRLNPADKLSGLKGRIEKWILRKAFEDMLPESVAWRQKEQFSDGVGYSWIDTLKQIASSQVSDEQFAQAAERFPINPPMSKEEYHYRTLFEEHFPSDAAAQTVPSVPSIACSTPIALEWDAAFKNAVDPSGRAVKAVHNEAY
ncbi:MAG: asparagine synthase B [Candidatus Symbiothrix sp.]|nr:asparagine synthase B [Candidatus Symbiothrix sp.]